MAKPTLYINGHNYESYIISLEITRNDLDAEGSGRDVQNGLMYRTRIAQKAKLEVKLGQVRDTLFQQLLADINPPFFNAYYLDPITNGVTVKTFYTAEVNLGSQRYDKASGATLYTGASFSLTER